MTKFRKISIAALLLLTAVSCTRLGSASTESGSASSGLRFVAFLRSSPLSATKTEYQGGAVADGQKERINWIAGDRVTLLSPQAKVYNKQTNPWTEVYSSNSPRFSVSDYVIGSSITYQNEYSQSGLENVSSDANGLLWDENAGDHYFYNVYPAAASLPAEVRSNVGFTHNGTDGVITAYLPAAQTYATDATLAEAGIDHRRLAPDMHYAWMWGGQKATSPSDIGMYFSPMITTFQISVSGEDAQEIELSEFQLISENCALHGTFTATVHVSGAVTRTSISNMSVTYSGIPARSAGNNDVIRFVLPAGSNKVTVSSSKKLTLTVFAYPQGPAGKETVLDGLSVRFISPGTTRTLKLQDAARSAWVQFPAGKKINITGLTLPMQVNPWRFTVEGSDLGEELSDVVVSPVQVEEFKNEYASLEDYTKPDTYVPGKFTVSDGKQVWFASGNLVVTVNNGDVNDLTWAFEDEQYNYSYGINGSTSGTGHPYVVPGQSRRISHFGWATAGNGAYDAGHQYTEPYSIEHLSSDYNAGGLLNRNGYGPSLNTGSSPYTWGPSIEFTNGATQANTWHGTTAAPYCEWGIHFDDAGVGSDSKTDGSWYTLSAYEWNYLLTQRPDYADLYGMGRIYVAEDDKYVNGLFLLCDNWNLPSSCSFTAGTSSGYSTNTYTTGSNTAGFDGSWAAMEAAGAVFLPASGERQFRDNNEWRFYNSGGRGYYASSSAYPGGLTGYGQYYICFRSDPDYIIYPNAASARYDAIGVRLVHD